jgi:hypothetical protein
MSDTLTPAKSANTTTPRDTHVEVMHTAGESILLYRPEDNALIALYPDEWRDCRQEARENRVVIEELQKANKAVTEQSLAVQDLLRQPNAPKARLVQAQNDLDKALETQVEKGEAAKKRIETITDQKTDSGRLVELLPLVSKRTEKKVPPIYVSAKRLKAALADKRIYLVNGEAERTKPPKEKLFNGAKFNVKEARNRFVGHVQDQAKFEKKWKLAPDDADEYSIILTEWAKVMGTTVTAWLERGKNDIAQGILKGVNSDPNSPDRVIEVKPEAQFMRWAGGAGLEANFLPFQGNLFDKRDKTLTQKAKRLANAAQFDVKANADASFSIAEAKIETSLYLPHAAGWNLKTGDSDQSLNLGYFRLRGDLKLYAMAGASIALEAGAAVMVTAGKQGLRGTPKGKKGVKAKVGANGEVKVFAGLKEGVDLAGALQWLNPEGLTNPSSPKKVDINKALAEYVDMATVKAEAAAIQGLSASAGFECNYINGDFVIAAKASSCLGLGDEGNVGAKVCVNEIAQFLMFLSHQLKHVDYKKIAHIFKEVAFLAANQILFLHMALNQNIERFVGKTIQSLSNSYQETIRDIGYNGRNILKNLEKGFQQGWGWYAYMPPEARGALIASISRVMQIPENIKNYDLKNLAAFSVNELLLTTQTSRHLEKTLQRITFDMQSRTDNSHGINIIDAIVKDTKFEGCLYRCEAKLAAASPLLGRPFMKNDEPDFIISNFPLHSSSHMLA